jgi:hypothetical protein
LKRAQRPSAFVCAFAIVQLLSCDESLPTYREPDKLFAADMNVHFSYGPALGRIDSSLLIYVNVRNVFDETFDAKVQIDGTVDIELARDPSFRKKFTISDANIYSAKSYNLQTKILTLDAGDSLRFVVAWNFIDENGRDLRANVFKYVSDAYCNDLRGVAGPEVFIVHGRVKLFDKTGYVACNPLQVQVCHVAGWMDMCPKFPLDSSCSYYQQIRLLL